MTGSKVFAGVLLLAVVLLGSSAQGQHPPVPFVAGFERFARHGVVPENVGGQLLLAELSCVACHDSEDLALEPKRGPILTGSGNRVSADWMRAFLNNPSHTKPGTTMPDVLAFLPEADRAEAVEALVAFLASQETSFPEPKAGGGNPLPHEFWNQGDAERGEKLYHLVGCVACHQPDPQYDGGHAQPSAMSALLATLEPEDIEEMGLTESARPVTSVPLPDLADKYTNKALTFFLAEPETVRPGVRMPNLKLELVEAADLVAYLTRDASTEGKQGTAPKNPALVAQGKKLFTALSCVNCHEMDGVPPPEEAPLATKSLAQLTAADGLGCLGKPTPGLPHFGLDEPQVKSITAALTALAARDEAPAQEVSLDLTLLKQNCYACHSRDERGGVGPDREQYFETVSHVDLGDEGRLPPPLDHVGMKLTPGALAKVLEGSGDIRPHMRVRMPKYPQEIAKPLPAAFAAADQPASLSEAEVFPNHKGMEEAGRLLLNTGCVQCHPIRGESADGAVGVDLEGITQRVRPQWFLEFLRNPAELKKRTRMPSFFPNGQSGNPDILDGDMDRQIEAMWSYLKDVKSQKLPDKIEEARSQQFELVPEGRPIVLRTFMDSAGPHAIAVGNPAGVHYAFDAEKMRLAEAWRGQFLDAYGTWFVRSAPPAVPLGTDLVSFPPGLPFAMLSGGDEPWPAEDKEAAQYQFLGYRLDPAGVPTFRYVYRGYVIEDRIEALEDGGLKRLVKIKPGKGNALRGTLWFQAHQGKNLKQQNATCTEPGGVTVRLAEAEGAILWQDKKNPETKQWRVPVSTDRPLEVIYQW
ncbi:MAG: cytochrome oxidase [Pirellulaceae bacterium]